MSGKKKFYVVWEGAKPGIYDTWEEAGKQVQGYPAAKYKSFSNKAEAEQAFRSDYWSYVNKGANAPTAKGKLPVNRAAIDQNGIAVDAACSGNPGDMEYRGVHIASGKQLFHVGPLAEGTNNIGEFLAIVHCLAWLEQQNSPPTVIYSDSRNALLWIKARKCNTKLEHTSRNGKIFELIDRAEKWLATHSIKHPLKKWETADWGEIPADFGRK
jgi:ribonuclease HI